MADTKISALTALAAFPATDDEFVLVDKSDTTMAASGTDKRITRANLLNVPAARVYNNGNISHATSGTAQNLTFDSERFDTDTIHSTSSNTSRLTCNTAGVYVITGHVVWAANATGYRTVQIFLNGATNIATEKADAVSIAGQETWQSISTIYKLAATDYVELRVNQTSTAALNVLLFSNYSPEFAMTYIGTG